MAIRVFNNCKINGTTVSMSDFATGTGTIVLLGKDLSKTTDDHLVHFLRTNIYYTTDFKLFGDYSTLSTDPENDVFGGTHIFYLDSTQVCSFKGVVTTKYDEKQRITSVIIQGEAEDA